MRNAPGTSPENYTYNGLPYVGRPLNLKDKDTEDRLPTLTHKAHVRVFDLDDETDLKDYTEIWNSIMKGHALLGKEEMRYDEVKKNWRIFVRWTDEYYTEPKNTEGIINEQS